MNDVVRDGRKPRTSASPCVTWQRLAGDQRTSSLSGGSAAARRRPTGPLGLPYARGVIADEVRTAYESRDLAALGPLLAEEVTWGDPGTPGACHCRDEVLAAFGRLKEAGVAAELLSVRDGPGGVVVHLGLAGGQRWQALSVRDGRIVEIRGYDDASSAQEAVGAS